MSEPATRPKRGPGASIDMSIEATLHREAEQRKRALVFLAVFWIDNIFTAFVADAMSECFPYTYKRGKWKVTTVLALLGYELFIMVFCAFLVLGAMYYLSNHFQVERASDGMEVSTEAGTKARERVRTRDIACRFIMYSASFTMGCAHKTVAYYSWYGIEALITGEGSTVGSCNISNSDLFTFSAIIYAMFVATLFTLVSIWVAEKATVQTNTTWRFVLQMIADSFAIAIGWSMFNMLEVLFKCEVSWLYTNSYGNITLAASVTLAGYYAFKWLIDHNNDPDPTPDERLRNKFRRRLKHFGLTGVMVVVALSVVYSFYRPLSSSSLSDSQIGYIMFAIGIVYASGVSAFGVYKNWDSEESEQSVHINYFFSVSGWVCCYIYWFAFDEFVAAWVEGKFGNHLYLQSFVILASTVVLFGALARFLIHVLDDNGDDESGSELPDGGEAEPLVGEGKNEVR